MQEHNSTAIIFDLDGTLLDSLADIATAANAVLAARDFPQHDLNSFRYLVGEGVSRLFAKALPDDQCDEPTICECVADFREIYANTWNVQSKAYDGIVDLLSELTARSVPKAVLSNKPHVFTEKCVKYYFGEFDFFEVRGQRDGTPRKPDPAGALKIADQLKVGPDRFLYVGDTAIDMQTAKRAEMFAVGVLWGFRSATELKESGADVLVRHPAEILTLLSGRSTM